VSGASPTLERARRLEVALWLCRFALCAIGKSVAIFDAFGEGGSR
jgi:hypothetical protein